MSAADDRRRRHRVQGNNNWSSDSRPRSGNQGDGSHGNDHPGNSGRKFTYEKTERGGPPTHNRNRKQQRSDQVPKFGEIAARPEPARHVNLKRVRILSKTSDVTSSQNGGGGGILYWMNRDQRTEDNWAFLYAQELALHHKLPLYACFCVVDKYMNMNMRHYTFMIQGLREVEKECHELGIPFHLLSGPADQEVLRLSRELNVRGVVTDFTPLKTALGWLESVKKGLPDEVPLYQVDTHNVVPCWEASAGLAGRAFIMRGKIEARINEFFTEFPTLVKHPHNDGIAMMKNDYDGVLSSLTVDRDVQPVQWAVGGMRAGKERLEIFLEERLPDYGVNRNNPEHDCVSNLSPWFHFGHISPQRCILEVKLREREHRDGVEEFFKEAVVWREMSDNFCFYNDNYDSILGATPAILQSLRAHAADPRQYVYTLDELEQARTHDDLWNTAQIQMVREGKMHTFFRTYWGKRLVEWVQDPGRAYEWAVYLNDKYNLDGNDPNGYAGCAWCVIGVHDREFPDRPITGKLRTMSYKAQFNKFDVKKMVRKYGAKAYHK